MSMQYKLRGINIFTWQLFHRGDAANESHCLCIYSQKLQSRREETTFALIHVTHFQFCQAQKCCSTSKVAGSLALWEFIQSWAAVQQSPGCMLAGRGSLGRQRER